MPNFMSQARIPESGWRQKFALFLSIKKVTLFCSIKRKSGNVPALKTFSSEVHTMYSKWCENGRMTCSIPFQMCRAVSYYIAQSSGLLQNVLLLEEAPCWMLPPYLVMCQPLPPASSPIFLSNPLCISGLALPITHAVFWTGCIFYMIPSMLFSKKLDYIITETSLLLMLYFPATHMRSFFLF